MRKTHLTLVVVATITNSYLGVQGRAQDETTDNLLCPEGSAATGLSIGTPSRTSWPSWPKLPAHSLCLECTRPDSHGYNFQTCLQYEDSRSTLTQKVSCAPGGEFLRSFSKPSEVSTASLRCGSPEQPRNNESAYESRFPSGAQAAAKENWKKWTLEIACNQGSFICGVTFKALRKNESSLPSPVPLCCSPLPSRTAALRDLVFSSWQASSGGVDCNLTVAILACVVIVLAIALTMCVINVWCCRFLPVDCSPNSSVEPYEATGEPAAQGAMETLDHSPYSTMSRADTGKRRENGANAKMISNSGQNGRLKRPGTSVIRSKERN